MEIVVEKVVEVTWEVDLPLNMLQKDTLTMLQLLNGKEDNKLKFIGEWAKNIVEAMLIVSAR